VGVLASIPVVAFILVIILGVFVWKGSIKPRALGGPRAVVEIDETTRRRGFIGINHESIPEVVLAKLKIESGVMVTHVQPQSPADSCGIIVGDVLLAVDGVPVKSRGHIESMYKDWKPGQVLKLTVVHRDAEESDERVVDCRLISFDEMRELQLRQAGAQRPK